MAAAESVLVDYRDGWVIARWQGEIDMANATIFERDTLEALNNKDFGLIIDLEKVSYIDSAGMRSIISIRRLLGDRQQKTLLVRPPDSRLRRTLEIGGLDAIIPIYDSVEEAEATIT